MTPSRFARLLIAPLTLAALLSGCGDQAQNGGPSEDWTQFRGPTQDGHSRAKGLPVSWGVDKNIVWKTPLTGRAWSSPIVVGDRIYLTNATTGKDEDDLHAPVSLRVLALDAKDGKVLWDKEVLTATDPSSRGIHEKNSHASPTPVFDQGRIYAQFAAFGTACVDEQGTIIWTTREPAYNMEHGTGSCPVIVDDLLIFHCDGTENPFVVALDKATGKERWRRSRAVTGKTKGYYGFSTPLLLDLNGEKQLVSVGAWIVQGISPKDGREIWRVSHGNYAPVPRPVFGQGLIFVNTGFDKASLLAIKPGGQGDVTETHISWETRKNTALTPSMLVVDTELYMLSDSGTMTCMDAKTGTVLWSERVAKATSASLFHADGKIYAQDEYGTGYVLKAGKKYELLSTNTLADKSMASYAVHGKRLLIRTQHALRCVGK
jgi:outer membrane protein assembly factor BamB